MFGEAKPSLLRTPSRTPRIGDREKLRFESSSSESGPALLLALASPSETLPFLCSLSSNCLLTFRLCCACVLVQILTLSDPESVGSSRNLFDYWCGGVLFHSNQPNTKEVGDAFTDLWLFVLTGLFSLKIFKLSVFIIIFYKIL